MDGVQLEIQMWGQVFPLETKAFCRGLERLKCKLQIKMIEKAASSALVSSCPLGLGSDEKPRVKTEKQMGNMVTLKGSWMHIHYAS